MGELGISFEDIKRRDIVCIYAGDIPLVPEYGGNLVGLSLKKSDSRHVRHDITNPYPLPDEIAHSYQAEDVFEHIEYEKLCDIMNEIYRILIPGGLFRLSVPDYACDILYNRSLKDDNGNIIFDPGGGGDFCDGKVVNGGHLWFPKYESVKALFDKVHFSKVEFLHYYKSDGTFVVKPIDYSKGWIQRTPDHDERVQKPYRPMSIVVDAYK